MGQGLTHSCKTTFWFSSTHPFCIWATWASLFRLPLLLLRSLPGVWVKDGSLKRGGGPCVHGGFSLSALFWAVGGVMKCSVGVEYGHGTP